MNDAFHKEVLERHENPERGNASHPAAELLAHPLAHELTLEPGLDIARCIVCTTFIGRTEQAKRFPLIELVTLRGAHPTPLLGTVIGTGLRFL
jgi:hypothetical protein